MLKYSDWDALGRGREEMPGADLRLEGSEEIR